MLKRHRLTGYALRISCGLLRLGRLRVCSRGRHRRKRLERWLWITRAVLRLLRISGGLLRISGVCCRRAISTGSFSFSAAIRVIGFRRLGHTGEGISIAAELDGHQTGSNTGLDGHAAGILHFIRIEVNKAVYLIPSNKLFTNSARVGYKNVRISIAEFRGILRAGGDIKHSGVAFRYTFLIVADLQRRLIRIGQNCGSAVAPHSGGYGHKSGAELLEARVRRLD